MNSVFKGYVLVTDLNISTLGLVVQAPPRNENLSSHLNSTNETGQVFHFTPTLTSQVFDVLTILASVLGMVLNAVVMFYSFCPKLVTGNFKFFLGNLAVVDFLCCLGKIVAAHMRRTAMLPGTKILTLFWPRTLEYTSSRTAYLALFLALPLLTFNRYKIIVKQKPHYFTNGKIIQLCLIPYIPILIQLSSFFSPFAKSLHPKSPNFGDYVRLWPYLSVDHLIYPCGILGAIFAVYYTWRLYEYLSKNMTDLASALDKSETQVKEEKRLVLIMVFQAMTPLILWVPSILVELSFQIHRIRNFDDHRLETGISGYLENELFPKKMGFFIFRLLMFLFPLNTVLDAVITLAGVKKYRCALRQQAQNICRRPNTENNVIELHPRRQTLS